MYFVKGQIEVSNCYHKYMVTQWFVSALQDTPTVPNYPLPTFAISLTYPAAAYAQSGVKPVFLSMCQFVSQQKNLNTIFGFTYLQ